MGREGRHVLLPAGHGPTGPTDLVSYRRSRCRDAHLPFQVAVRRQDSQRSHRRDCRPSRDQGAHSAHVEFAGRNARWYAGGRAEFSRVFRGALVPGSGGVDSLRGRLRCGARAWRDRRDPRVRSGDSGAE